MDLNKDLENVNKTTYSDKKAVDVYDTDYIRASEEYFFEKYIKPGMKVLDLGCGVGRSTRFVKDRGAIVVGVDMVEAFLQRGRERHPDLDLRLMNAAELSFQDKIFDVVMFPNQGIDCVHPRSKRAEVLKQACRVLKDEGVFMYTHHNSIALPRTKRNFLDFWKNILKFHFGYHVRTEHHKNGELYYAFNNIWSEEKFIYDCGFKVIEVGSNTKKKHSKLWTAFFERWPMYICKKK